MHKAQVNKLYAKLNHAQLAALAFNALVRGDVEEVEAIVASIDRRYYQCINQSFTRRYNGYIDLGLYYGTIYWKARTYLSFAENLYHQQPSEENQGLMFHHLDHVLAMETALQEVCVKDGIDVMAVKQLAGCTDECRPEKFKNDRLANSYVESFAQFLG